ncbi:hypothetical protein [Frondihabitans sp. VKM Ac-2883]|uniref:hypothetical protein n=1 Tax=Frondihabitans sp. VKM Ac-2883 TaxID=2783823 RepID=UPI00188AE580|nr:hypothetical protein [Frondihabitans sp. VKM Ac-2883]MBF4574720.1 hypothetical protein [Frondihabitans sp. VKM Ac-2883]
MTDITAAQMIGQVARAAFDEDAMNMHQTVSSILEQMASQPTREGRMWRRVPVNLLARIEGALHRKDTLIEQQAEQIAGLTAERDEAWRERSEMLDKAMRRAVRSDRARALAARHRYRAERWADPLPVPEWVIELESILDDEATKEN